MNIRPKLFEQFFLLVFYLEFIIQKLLLFAFITNHHLYIRGSVAHNFMFSRPKESETG